MKNLITRFLFIFACMALFSFGATAQQNASAKYKQSPKVTVNKASKTNTGEYEAARKKFQQEKPNATRKEIDEFLKQWNK